MNQIQKLLCYSGLEVQDYRDCQPEIEEENRRKMHVYLNMACGLLFAITCLSGGIGVLREHSLLYCIALVVCAGLRVVDLMFPDQNGLLLRWALRKRCTRRKSFLSPSLHFCWRCHCCS